MFIDRVHAADGEFRFSTEGLACAYRICVELDGLPLAIEMAAARVPLLGLQKVHDALAERLIALRHTRRESPARHRTLQTALDWSHALLIEPEQGLLRALGVCAGGFTADLATSLVEGDTWDAMDHLGSLVKRSLVVSSHEDPPRYRLLETVRAYALARLREAGDEMAARRRHASFMVEFFQSAHDGVSGRGAERPHQSGAVFEMENAREALRWTMANHPELAVRLSAYVARSASITGWRTEAFGWLMACEPLARDPHLSPRWKALWARNFAAQSLFFDHPQTIDRARDAVALCVAAGEPLHQAYSLIYLARAFKRDDREIDRTVRQLSALLDEHPGWGPDLRALFLNCEGHAFELGGDVERALTSYQAARDLAESAGLRLAATLSDFNLARALHGSGNHDRALAELAAVIVQGADQFDVTMAQCRVLKARIMLETGPWQQVRDECAELMHAAQRLGSLDMLDVLAPGLARAGRPRAAALLVGLVTRVRNARGSDWNASESADMRLAEETMLQTLDRATVQELVKAGGRLDDQSAATLLRADDVAPGAPPTRRN